MAKAVRNVGRERRGNPQTQQPSSQRWNPTFLRAESSITIELA
jgi:hypothetical protein